MVIRTDGQMKSWRTLIGGNYLSVALVAVPIAICASALNPQQVVFKGQSATILISIVSGAISVILWLIYRRTEPYQPTVIGFLLSLIVAWSVVFFFSSRDEIGWNYSSLVLPLLVVLLLLKPLPPRLIIRSAVLLAWAIVSTAIAFEIWMWITDGILEMPGIRVPGLNYRVTEGERWQGPFTNPNYAGPAFAFVIVLAASVKPWLRWTLISASILFLLLAGSRSAWAGTLAGLAVYFIFSQARPLERLPRRIRVAITMSVAFLMTLGATLMDPQLNGRTRIWEQFISAWVKEPWTGIGSAEVTSARLPTGDLVQGVHGHNEILDLLGRWGLFGAMPIVVVLGTALLVATRAAHRGQVCSLALVVTYITIGLTEVQGGWIYLSIPISWLLVAVLMSPRSTLTSDELLTAPENPSVSGLPLASRFSVGQRQSIYGVRKH